MRGFWRNLLSSGIEAPLDAEVQIKLFFVNTISLFGALVVLFFGLRDLATNQLLLALASFALDAAVVAVLLGMRLSKNYRLGAWFIPLLTFVYFSFLTWSGGSGSTGSIWILTYPLISIFLLGARTGAVVAGAFFGLQAAFLFVEGWTPAWGLGIEFKLRILGTSIITFSFSVAFEVIRARAQREVEAQRRQLLEAKAQTDGIFRNVREGLFLLDHDLVISSQHSESLEALLGLGPPAGRRLLEALGSLPERERAAVHDYLGMFFAPSPSWQLLAEINPLEQVTLGAPGAARRLEFTFHPVELEGGRRILVTVRDVTEAFELASRLKEEEDRSARQMRHLFQIIHVKPELLLQFLADAGDEVASINRRLKDPQVAASDLVESLFQGIHAIKGNAALVGLTDFSTKVHDIEGVVAEFRGRSPAWEDFLEMTVRLAQIQAELNEIHGLMEQMAQFQRAVDASGEPRDLLSMTLRKALDNLGRSTGIAAVLDTSEFDGQLVPAPLRKLAKDVLLQLLRNSFAHGLEAPGERAAAGKPPQGRVRVATGLDGNRLVLSYRDDGRGLSVAQLRQELARREGLTPDQVAAWSDAAVLATVFRPGVSLAAEVTQTAGRGVGLALVKSRVEAAGGQLRLRTAPGKGLAFDIELPLP